MDNASEVIRKENEKKKIPRPMNAFMLFSYANRHLMKQKNPEESNRIISIRLGHAWDKLCEAERRKYYEIAKEVKLQHQIKYPDYVYCPRPHKKKKFCHCTRLQRKAKSCMKNTQESPTSFESLNMMNEKMPSMQFFSPAKSPCQEFNALRRDQCETDTNRKMVNTGCRKEQERYFQTYHNPMCESIPWNQHLQYPPNNADFSWYIPKMRTPSLPPVIMVPYEATSTNPMDWPGHRMQTPGVYYSPGNIYGGLYPSPNSLQVNSYIGSMAYYPFPQPMEELLQNESTQIGHNPLLPFNISSNMKQQQQSLIPPHMVNDRCDAQFLPNSIMRNFQHSTVSTPKKLSSGSNDRKLYSISRNSDLHSCCQHSAKDADMNTKKVNSSFLVSRSLSETLTLSEKKHDTNLSSSNSLTLTSQNNC